VTTSRRSADRALLRDLPDLAEGVKKNPAKRAKRTPAGKCSDIAVVYKWRSLDIENPPECPGIYAVKDRTQDLWYYIGKSQNIASRIVVKNHPIQVTKNIKLNLSYLYLKVDKQHIGWAERYLIKEHDPEWNGSTSFNASWYTRWMCCDLPLSNNEFRRRLMLEAIEA
jgi:hypothetical protein